MFNVVIEYPSAEEERKILTATTGLAEPQIAVVERRGNRAAAPLVREVPAAENIVDYATRLVRATRPAGLATTPRRSSFGRGCWGAGPRAGQALLLGAKALALLEGRSVVSFEDIRSVALPVLRHRILVNFQAEADGVDSDQIIARLLDAVR